MSDKNLSIAIIVGTLLRLAVLLVIVSLIFTMSIDLTFESSEASQESQASYVDVTFPNEKDGIQLSGLLYRPEGIGPFPAVVLLHGCGGIKSPWSRHNWWAKTLRTWGYVALLVDSLGPRGETNICGNPFAVDPLFKRLIDAYAAKSYLTSLPFVDGNRIAVMGWSHGGWTTLYIVDNVHLSNITEKPFKAAIAFYPWCSGLFYQLNTSLLILIGEKDDWTPASQCETMLSQSKRLVEKTAYKITLKVYPEATHGFDELNPIESYLGHKIGRHAESAAKAEEEVKRFFNKHLGMK